MKKIILETVDSTNNYAKQIAKNTKEDTLIIAKTQTGGRGRMGRKFISFDGGIYMSFLLHPDILPRDTVKLTVMAAVAVSRAVRKITGIETKIKWVNDLYLNGKKVCGILTEGRFDSEKNGFDYVIVGIGLNLFMPKGGFNDEIKNIATALFSEPKSGLYEDLTEEINKQFQDIYYGKNDGYFPEYKKRSFILGKEIEYIKDNVLYTAKAVDINENAELVVIKDGERLCLNSGEVTIKI